MVSSYTYYVNHFQNSHAIAHLMKSYYSKIRGGDKKQGDVYITWTIVTFKPS